VALLALAALAAALSSPQLAAADREPIGFDTASLTPVPSGFPETPDDYSVTPREALETADDDPKILDRKAELTGDEELTASVKAEDDGVWEVAYSLDDERVNLVIIDGTSGGVTQSLTGDAVSWPMARGNEGQFGHILNAPWVWGPLAGIFLLGLFDFRRPRKWVHLDLLVLLSFGVSQAFYNEPNIGVSVPLCYPPLIYLIARMLWIGFRGAGGAGTAGERLRPSTPRWLMIALLVGLIGLRIAANVADSGVIDVGYAGVIGADKITDAHAIYGDGSFPDDNPTGDTYGPANYFAYVPFEAVLPWSGSWDDLPAAHAASIFFDLAAIAGLFALGGVLTRRGEGEEEGGGGGWRGDALGLTLAFAWVAYPYTDFALQSNSNDTLLGALLIWSLVLFASPLARGALLAVAALTKFAPLALVPLYGAGEHGLRLRTPEARHALLRPIGLFAAAFTAASVLLIAHPVIDPGLAEFVTRTVRSQVGRESPFSIWGQASLEWLQALVMFAVVALGVLLAFLPQRRTLTQLAALSAAVIIGVQLTLEHWFYLYIPWFAGALFVAIAAAPQRPQRLSDSPG
jgi:hypothetical protein